MRSLVTEKGRLRLLFHKGRQNRRSVTTRPPLRRRRAHRPARRAGDSKRANLTSKKAWLNDSSSYLTTTYAYDT